MSCLSLATVLAASLVLHPRTTPAQNVGPIGPHREAELARLVDLVTAGALLDPRKQSPGGTAMAKFIASAIVDKRLKDAKERAYSNLGGADMDAGSLAALIMMQGAKDGSEAIKYLLQQISDIVNTNKALSDHVKRLTSVSQDLAGKEKASVRPHLLQGTGPQLKLKVMPAKAMSRSEVRAEREQCTKFQQRCDSAAVSAGRTLKDELSKDPKLTSNLLAVLKAFEEGAKARKQRQQPKKPPAMEPVDPLGR